MKKICFVINAESPHVEVNSEDLSKLRDDKFLGYDYSTIGICNNERKINRLDTEFSHFVIDGVIYDKKLTLDEIKTLAVEYAGADNFDLIIFVKNETVVNKNEIEKILLEAELNKQISIFHHPHFRIYRVETNGYSAWSMKKNLMSYIGPVIGAGPIEYKTLSEKDLPFKILT